MSLGHDAPRGRRSWLLLLFLGVTQCSTAGSRWVAEPNGSRAVSSDEGKSEFQPPAPKPKPAPKRLSARTIGAEDERAAALREAATLPVPQSDVGARVEGVGAGHAASEGFGKRLGTFRNTYYDFPQAVDYEGPLVSLFDARCRAVAKVPESFHDAVCVQGSGLLDDGRTVSFAKRDCRCARRCPRTGQRICFEALDRFEFPWGRGATGQPIVPLLSVAVDSDVIPLGTPLYIPQYVGMPRDASHSARHDGCFIAQDRGIKVRGEHVDIFTGDESMTALWNELVPSNRGVTIVIDSPHCARANPKTLRALPAKAPRSRPAKASKRARARQR